MKRRLQVLFSLLLLLSTLSLCILSSRYMRGRTQHDVDPFRVINIFSPLPPMKSGISESALGLIDEFCRLTKGSGTGVALWVAGDSPGASSVTQMHTVQMVRYRNALSLSLAQLSHLLTRTRGSHRPSPR